MEAMDKKKIDRLTKGLVLNIFVFVCCVVYIIVAILPKYTALGEIVTKINDTATNISSLKKDGVNAAKFTELLTQLGRKKEVPDVVFADSDKLDKVLTKPTTYSKDYLSWLVDENNKVSIIDKEIQANDAILGNIIPVFTNSSSMNTDADVANQITLASFISYVEKDILSKYSLVSYAPLGISNIEFPDKKDTSVNIGSFKITLDFKGKNSNIISLVDTLQKSGKLTIRGGKLIPENTQNTTISAWKGLSDLSNLLVGVSSFSLDGLPDIVSEENKGSMTLEFFVEGLNYQKITALRAILATKYDLLQKSTKEKGSICTKAGSPLCNETTTANAIASIKWLIKNLAALKPKFDAFKKGDITIDVNKEMDTLSDIKASLDSIEMTYSKNNAILEKAKKQMGVK